MSAWPEEQIERLKTYHAEGITFTQIGMLLGCGRNASIGKAYRLGLKRQQGVVAKVRPAPHQRRVKLHYVPVRLVPQPPPAPMKLSEPAPLNVPLLELTNTTCKWPHGDEAPFLFCGHLTFGFQTYCPFHTRRSVANSRPISADEHDRRHFSAVKKWGREHRSDLGRSELLDPEAA